MHAKRQGRAWYHWYAESDTPADRKLILKLDLLILPYAVIAYWIKYIDQSNLNNAYVAGLAEDLGFRGNELVTLQSMYTIGAVVGQLPFTFVFPMFKMNYIIPGLEIGWGIFTLLQYRTQGYAELMAYRFMVGLFEAAFFPGVHFVLGAWYRGDELGRRGGIFYIGQMLGTLTAGLIQSGASAHLHNVAGLAGWRWMFIIVSLMTIPVGVAGIFIWPGTPARPNLLILTQAELDQAVVRLEANKSDNTTKPKKSMLQVCKAVFSDKKIYILTFWTVLFWNAGTNSTGGYLLWLKSLKRWDAAKITQLGATAPAAGILYVLFINFSSDLFLGRTGAIVLAHSMNLLANVILAVWNVPEAAKWFAFNIGYFQVAMSSVLYGWANDMLRHDVQERAFIVTFINMFAQSTTAWTPLLVFKTVEAPRFLKGWTFAATNSFVIIFFTIFVIRTMSQRMERNLIAEEESSYAVITSGDSDAGSSDPKLSHQPRSKEDEVSVVNDLSATNRL